MRRRNCTGSAARTSWLSLVMLPWSASISRLASRSSVVLPEPEPPTMARNSPSATSSETSSTALTRPPSKLLPTCANAIRGAVCILPSPGGGGSPALGDAQHCPMAGGWGGGASPAVVSYWSDFRHHANDISRHEFVHLAR